MNVINKGGYQILIGATTGAIGYIFLKVLKTLNKNPPKGAKGQPMKKRMVFHLAIWIND